SLKGTPRYPLPCAAPPNLQTVLNQEPRAIHSPVQPLRTCKRFLIRNLSSAGMSSSGPDPVFPNVGQEHERGQRRVFTLTRHPGSSEVVLRTGDEVPLSLPLVKRGDFTLYWDRRMTYYLRTVPPPISFLLSPDPPSPDERLGTTAHGSLSFDHGKAEESIAVTYTFQWIGTEKVTMTWLHLFALLPGYHPVVKLLLHHGADPKAVTRPLNLTPLHMAATRETATLLIENGAEVNARDSLDQTPLHLATRDGHHSIVDLLLAHGADPNIRDEDKQTPLQSATRRGHQSIVDLLLAHGADVLATDDEGRTPLSEAKTGEVILVMIELTEDLNRQDQQTGNTPLHSCCLHGREEAAKHLIEKGVRLDVENNKGETALDTALANGHRRIASLLPRYLQSPLSSTGRFERDFEVVKDHKHKDGVLGEGAFGRVFKARRRGTDDVFAIKEIPFPPEDAEKTLREVRAAMELSRERKGILTHHDAWLEDRRTSDEAATSTQADGEDESARVQLSSSPNAGDSISRGATPSQGGAVLRQKVVRFRTSTPVLSPHPAFSNEGQEQGPGEQHPQSGNLSAGMASPSGTRADIDPRKGSSGEESSESSSSPEEERSDDIAGGHSGREELQQANRSQQAATIEEGESRKRPSPSRVGIDDGIQLLYESDQSNQSQQRETSGEEGSSDRPPFLAGESGDASEPGQDSDQQDESGDEDESRGSSSSSQQESDGGITFEETVEIGRNNRRLDESSETSSPSQEESDDGIRFEETETGQNDPSQDESSETSSPSEEESDNGIRFEETETGQNDPSKDESSETSSPSQEESDDDGIRFQDTEEIGRKNRSQDGIAFNQGGSRQENQRSLARGNEEESDEPPTGSSAQGGGSESVWTSGAEGGSSTAAEEYLRKCTLTLYIQMDLMEMTLEDYIRRRNEGYLEKKSSALSEEDRRTARRIFRDLCDAVEFVHGRGFIHRDLKPSNVLLSPRENPRFECPYSVRLSDFGLSTRLVDEFGAGMYKTVGCGTVSYAAPEQLKGGPGSTSKGAKYGEGVDVYSLALIAVELAMPMSISERLRVFDGLRSPEVGIPKGVEESLDQSQLELVRRGLSHEPTERPTAVGLLWVFRPP
ncbi:unnamed protein product, partial [Cyprideis torosa]